MYRILPLLALLPAAALAAPRIDCHTTYGGATQTWQAPPVASPYRVEARPIGSYFLFRIVFQNAPAELASVKIYTYADRDDGPVLIHQATHPWPLPAARRRKGYGFTGLQQVYEPLRDGELSYWCEQAGEGRR